jgi:hypothetical protein
MAQLAGGCVCLVGNSYTADVLGWHNRAKTHFEAYALSQFTTPLVAPIKPDSAMHFARSTEKSGIGMFTSGYINRDPNGTNLRPHHYDMNLVYIDQLLRHFAWTKDTTFMRQTWSVIKRHLDWEVRNFDIDKNNLFDAYPPFGQVTPFNIAVVMLLTPQLIII